MDNIKQTTILNPPDAARIMDGLRDTGYDFNTAIADIVDNSIAANASVVYIHVDSDPNMNITVSIADDGIGMDQDGLRNAMKYGSAERPNPNSLGKFGLGLKTASTAFCKKLSVISRSEPGADILKVCWDLDHIAEVNEWELLSIEPSEDDIDLLEQAADGKSGTVVTWEKVDRLFQRAYASQRNEKKALERYINNLRSHIALVYQRFLDHTFEGASNIDIYLNDELVAPFDPFCSAEEKTDSMAEQTLEINDGRAYMKIRAHLLPRKDEFSSKEAAAASRLGNDTQGFYIYREQRLIHSGDWLGMFKCEPHFSLLRIELAFDHDADEFLNVDIKKSRILLNEDIYGFIKDSYLPAFRREAERRYRLGTSKQVAKTGKAPHESANKTIDSKASSVEKSKTTVVDETKNEVQVTNKNGVTKAHIKITTNSDKNACRVIPVETVDYNMLWDATITDEGKHAVLINMSHPFYQKVYYPLLSRSTSVTGMDSLLWALAEAELSSFNQESMDHFFDMKVEASRALAKLIEDLPDPNFDKDE